jgi:predicted nucleic acid-binding protein
MLRRMYKKLKLGDAIIAATALEHNLALITRNIADFRNIAGLRVLDPHRPGLFGDGQ